jgi:hypothetical protein
MTTVSVMSDLHLEFAPLRDLPGGDVLILAGDIWLARDMRPDRTDEGSRTRRERYRRFCREELAKYERVLVVTGNHEPYGDIIEEINDVISDFLAEAAPNARLLDMEVEVIDGVAFLGTPLWATCGIGNPVRELRIREGINDFRQIRTQVSPRHVRGFRPADANDIHQRAVMWLSEELPKHDRAVVIGHHAPSYLSAGDGPHFDHALDDAFCSNLHALIEANPQVGIWIHGHTHRAEHYRIGDTLVVANPRGYFPDERRSRFFEPGAEDFSLEELKLAEADQQR